MLGFSLPGFAIALQTKLKLNDSNSYPPIVIPDTNPLLQENASIRK